MHRHLSRALWLGLVCSAAAAAGQQTQTISLDRIQVVRPPDVDAEVPNEAVMLRQRDTSAALEAASVRRRLSLQSVRAQPVIALAQGEADMRPVLQNPGAPVNLAQRLRAAPQLAKVEADSFEVIEIPQGFVVRQNLAYRLTPGACGTSDRRRAIAEKGVQCFVRKGPGTNDSAAADERVQIGRDIAQLRAKLADPVQRAQIAAQVGAGEVARLEALDDQALEAEIVNTAEVAIEEVMFVPNGEAQDLRLKAYPGFGAVARQAGGGRLASPSAPQRSSLPPAQRRGPESLRTQPGPIQGATDFRAAEPLNISEDIPVDREIYLTGFTLGRAYEWRRRVSVTIAWCITGCRRTYYVEPYAGFSYGFGLRFPVRMQGTYQYRHRNGVERAAFVPQFVPINGSVQDYSRAGIAGSQLFDGQELVAEATAYSGLVYKLPYGKQGNLSLFDVGIDLTDRLPAPFSHGQFVPPAPGEPTASIVRTFDSVDLLLNRGDFGVAGARVHPAIKLRLESGGLSFDLRDKIAGSRQVMKRSGQAYPLAVNARHVSRFSVGDPVYNLAFVVTPGLVGRAFVDVSLWSNHWDWPVWFPELTVRLPPDGIDFTCHRDTVCNHDYRLQAEYWQSPVRVNPPPRRTNPARRTNGSQ